MSFGDKIYSIGKANNEYMLDIDPEKEMCQITFIGRNFKDKTEYRKTVENMELRKSYLIFNYSRTGNAPSAISLLTNALNKGARDNYVIAQSLRLLLKNNPNLLQDIEDGLENLDNYDKEGPLNKEEN